MERLWIYLILFYGICKSIREVLKKKSMEKCSVIEVLFFYTLFAFILTIPFSIGQGIFEVNFKYHLFIIVKSVMIFIAWLCAMTAIKKLSETFYLFLRFSSRKYCSISSADSVSITFLRFLLCTFEKLSIPWASTVERRSSQ